MKYLIRSLFLLLISARVVYVIDGDTLLVKVSGNTERVRLIGIDSPETFRNPKTERDSLRSDESIKSITGHGHQSEQYAKTLVSKGDLVNLEYDVQSRDKYGRILAYVYLKDGTMLNEKLLLDGYAKVYTIRPNVKYLERFKLAQKKAQKNALGLWNDK